MSIYNFPVFFNMVYTKDDGSLTDEALLYNDQLNQSLQRVGFFFNNGIGLPHKTNVQAAAAATDDNIPVGAQWFNTDLAKAQIKVTTSTIETITSS